MFTTSLSIPARILLMQGFNNMMFLVPIVMAFYQHVGGLTVADFLLIQGLFRLGAMVFEVPTGYLADRWQRHRQIQLALAVHALAHGILLVASSFTHILVAELCMAFSSALISGTLTAYLFEGLRAEGREAEFTTWQGRQFSTVMGAEVLAAPIGGWLYSLHTHAPVALGVGVDVIALCIALTLPLVPRQHGQRRHTHAGREVLAIMHHSLRGHPLLAAVILGPYLLFAFTAVLFWAIMAQLQSLQVSSFMQGVALSGYFLVCMVVGLRAQWVRSTFSPQHLWAFMPVALAISIVAVAWAPHPLVVWLGGTLGAGVVRAVGLNLTDTTINQQVADHERATIMSVANFTSLLLSAAFLLAAPWVLPHTGMGGMVVLFGTLTLALATPAMVHLIRTQA